jgi:signal peptidase I
VLVAFFAALPKPVRSIVETVLTLAVALAIAWLAQAYVIKPYQVPTPSMEPTLMVGDRVLADRLTLDFESPHRFQIVVFHPPTCVAGHMAQGACNTTNRTFRNGVSSTTYIKRVIGLPGETVWFAKGRVWVQDPGKTPFSLSEPYVFGHNATAGAALPRTHIPAGYYLMLGDNRAVSDDSRSWGLEPRAGIIGVARARYWPLSRIGGL